MPYLLLNDAQLATMMVAIAAECAAGFVARNGSGAELEIVAVQEAVTD